MQKIKKSENYTYEDLRQMKAFFFYTILSARCVITKLDCHGVLFLFFVWFIFGFGIGILEENFFYRWESFQD